jgi:hypothetical protein
MSLRASSQARLASYSQHSSNTTCHTPVLKSRTEASIRVPRMFKRDMEKVVVKLVVFNGEDFGYWKN